MINKKFVATTPDTMGTEANGSGYIALVTDLTTQRTDGILTKGGLVKITGNKIKIDNPRNTTKASIFFSNNQDVPLSVDLPLAVNSPGELVFNIPESLKEGEYALTIKTHYAGEGKSLLKRAKSLTYIMKIEVICPVNELE